MEQEVDYSKLPSNLILKHCNTHLGIEKIKKEHLGQLWIARINAGARELGTSYSVLINSMSKKNINLDRKILSDIAVSDSAAFEKIVKTATS